jgi:predicted patatin/cPLA2 family phospholipase
LSLSGGGPLGSFEMGIASSLMQNYGGNWDIITGVSAGSINAAYLSTIKKGDEKLFIEDYKKLWLSTTNEQVYSKVYFLNGKSLYDTSPLKSTLTKIFENKIPIRPVLISATSLVKGKSEIFTEIDIKNYGFIDIIMSSTAIPIYFPPYEFKKDLYVDGGVSSNLLIYEGINYCLNNFPNQAITVDAIVCGKKLEEDSDIINKNNIIDVSTRLINIIFQQVEYYQILNNILVLSPSINVTIYEEKTPIGISISDFNNSEYLWNQGYNFTNVNIYRDVINRMTNTLKIN